MQERERRHRPSQLVTSVATPSTEHVQVTGCLALEAADSLQQISQELCHTRQGLGCKHSPSTHSPSAGDFYQQKHCFSTAAVPAPQTAPAPLRRPLLLQRTEVGSAASAPGAEAGAFRSFAKQDKNASKAALCKRFLFAKATS